MKIGFLTEEYHTEEYRAGGIGRAFGKMAHWLAGRGHTVTVFVPSSKPDRFEEKRGLHVVRFVPHPLLPPRWRDTAYRRLRPKSIRDILWNAELSASAQDVVEAAHRAGEVQVVQVNPGFLAARMVRRGRVPVVVRAQLPWRMNLVAEFRRPTLATWANERDERACIRGAARVYAPSRAAADHHRRWSGRDVRVIRTPMFPIAESRELDTAVKRLGPSGSFGLFYGNLLGRKGAHVIADALPDFFARCPDLALLMCGRDGVAPDGGSMADLLRRRAGSDADRLFLLPALDHDDLFALIRAARFVLIPSTVDNLPNTLLEAMYFGKVVVGSRGASIDEIIEDGVDGLLAPVGDGTELARQMIRAAHRSDSERDAMGARARRKAAELFDPDRVMGEVLEEMEKAIEGIRS